jgi:hypothetical protein
MCCHVYPGNASINNGFGIDNAIYWIISHVVTTIRYYTFTIAVSMTHNNYNALKVNMLTTELPSTTSSWRIPSNSLHCFLYRLGTDHAEKTQFYCCIRKTTQKTSHAILSQCLHWCAVVYQREITFFPETHLPFLPCVYSVAVCSPVCYLAMPWPSSYSIVTS